MKIFLYDLETTGLDPLNCATHQLSGKIIINGKVMEEFDFHIQPFNGAEISQEALDVSGVTREQLASYPTEEEVFPKVLAMCSKYVNRYDRTDKFYQLGFNVQHFDNQFFREMWSRNGQRFFGSYFFSNCLDAMLLATPKLLMQRPNMPNFKQSTVAEYLGVKIDESKLHNANYDIELTQAIYDKVCGIY